MSNMDRHIDRLVFRRRIMMLMVVLAMFPAATHPL
jgi:hypothetical protein